MGIISLIIYIAVVCHFHRRCRGRASQALNGNGTFGISQNVCQRVYSPSFEIVTQPYKRSSVKHPIEGWRRMSLRPIRLALLFVYFGFPTMRLTLQHLLLLLATSTAPGVTSAIHAPGDASPQPPCTGPKWDSRDCGRGCIGEFYSLCVRAFSTCLFTPEVTWVIHKVWVRYSIPLT